MDLKHKGPNGTQKGGAQSYLLTMITSNYQAKLIKKCMLRGVEWFIEELKPLYQK